MSIWCMTLLAGWSLPALGYLGLNSTAHLFSVNCKERTVIKEKRGWVRLRFKNNNKPKFEGSGSFGRVLISDARDL